MRDKTEKGVNLGGWAQFNKSGVFQSGVDLFFRVLLVILHTSFAFRMQIL
jgi:hypothetical protein